MSSCDVPSFLYQPHIPPAFVPPVPRDRSACTDFICLERGRQAQSWKKKKKNTFPHCLSPWLLCCLPWHDHLKLTCCSSTGPWSAVVGKDSVWRFRMFIFPTPLSYFASTANIKTQSPSFNACFESAVNKSEIYECKGAALQVTAACKIWLA